jgi:hypothetical protein
MPGNHYADNVKVSVERSRGKRWDYAYAYAKERGFTPSKCRVIANTSVEMEKHGIFPGKALQIAMETYDV